jgi:hypothetical protein
MADDDLLRVSTRDGKYTVIQQAGGGMRFERHGEDWLAANESFVHVGLILVLAQDLEAANKVAEAAERFMIDEEDDKSYNGPGQQANHYAEKLRSRHNFYKSIEELRQSLKEWRQDRKTTK